ncbi:MAG: ABC transporter ATP-binding protein [Actinomycetota bacterium]|nr:ABC transporter ATP-binding protein [Actinomycetota bacterium]
MSVELYSIRKAFGATDALNEVTFEVGEGEFFSILGPSGCGKTTLLRIIAGLERPDSGVLKLGGVDVSRRPPAERGVGMVFQNYALFPHLTAAGNIGFGLKGRVSKRELAARVGEIAELLDLDRELLGRRPRQLSGGQRQRVALGRALIRKPRVLLMDEPLSGADALLRERMRSDLRRFHERAGTTTLYVTHDQREAMSMSDRLMVIEAGSVQQVGRPIDVYREPATAFAARFLGSPGMSLWPMQLTGNGSGAKLVGEAGDHWLLPGAHGYDPGAVLVGARPERIALTPPSPAACRLQCRSATVEPHGETAVVRALYGQSEIVATTGVDDVHRFAGEVEMWVEPSSLHLFSADSGRRLPQPATAHGEAQTPARGGSE